MSDSADRRLSLGLIVACTANLGGNHAENLRPGALARLSRDVALQGIQHSVRARPRHDPRARRDGKADWYVKLNPNARIPTIDDDGFVMWESAAINLYLARKYKSPLWPRRPQGEGRAFFNGASSSPTMSNSR